MKENVYYIYRIQNTSIIPNKSYIGFSKEPQVRFDKHLRDSKLNKDNFYLHKAIRKYGPESFKIEIIYCSKDIDYTLNIMEEYFIRLYNTHFKEGFGYNMTFGGEGTIGHVVSESSKKQMSLSHLGKKRGPYLLVKPRGPRSEETKEKIRQAHLGKSKPRGPRGPNSKSSTMSQETKNKISKTLSGRKLSDETKEKMRLSKLGKKRKPFKHKKLGGGAGIRTQPGP